MNSLSVLSDVQKNCKQLGHSVGNPLMLLFIEIQILIFFLPNAVPRECIFTNLNSKTPAEHCCIDNSVTTNCFLFFFFSLYILYSPLSSYIVAALQKEYEIFIRASCVEGTISPW